MDMSFAQRYHVVSAMVASPALTLFLGAALLPYIPAPGCLCLPSPAGLLTQLHPVVPSPIALRAGTAGLPVMLSEFQLGYVQTEKCFSSSPLLRHLSSQSPYKEGCPCFPPAPPVLPPVRLRHRSPRSLNEPSSSRYFLPTLLLFLLAAFKKRLMIVDAATAEVWLFRNSSVCTHEGGGSEERDETLLPS